MIAAMALGVAGMAGLAFFGILPGLGNDARGRIPFEREPGSPPALTEFLDYNCPYCGEFHREFTPYLRSEFADRQDLVLEYRHFPIVSGSSGEAAETAECGQEQGLGPEIHGELFNAAAVSPSHLDTAGIRRAAARAGMDNGALRECLAAGNAKAKVEADYETAWSAGVRGTPTFFLNGEHLRWEDESDMVRQIREAVATWKEGG